MAGGVRSRFLYVAKKRDINGLSSVFERIFRVILTENRAKTIEV